MKSMPSDSTVFVDTNVLLYAQDPRDDAKRIKAQVWLDHCWRAHRGRLSSQVLHEWYANLSRTAPQLTKAEARACVRRYRSWRPWEVDSTTVDEAWLIQDRFGFSYWDALIVASAQAMGCRWLLTEDLQHQQEIAGLTIINPFQVSPAELLA